MRGDWFSIRDLGGDGLEVRFGPDDRVAAVRLTSPGMAVVVPGLDPLVLPWADNVDPGGPCYFDGRTRWSIAPFTGKNALGIAIELEGPLQASATAVTRRLHLPLLQRMENAAMSEGNVRIPVLTGSFGLGVGASERAVLQVLALLLRNNESLRPRLADPERVSALQQELSGPWPSFPGERTGRNRDETDVLTTMAKLGFRHRYWRPVTRLDPTSAPAAVDSVAEALTASPYREGRPVDRGLVERLVMSEYFDLGPWPFTSLVDDAAQR